MKRHAGDRLRDRRIELNLSQREVGELIGVGQASISQWETDPPATIATIERLAYSLRVHPAWLAYEVGPKETRS